MSTQGRYILQEMVDEVTAEFYRTADSSERPSRQKFFANAGQRLITLSLFTEPTES